MTVFFVWTGGWWGGGVLTRVKIKNYNHQPTDNIRKTRGKRNVTNPTRRDGSPENHATANTEARSDGPGGDEWHKKRLPNDWGTGGAGGAACLKGIGLKSSEHSGDPQLVQNKAPRTVLIRVPAYELPKTPCHRCWGRKKQAKWEDGKFFLGDVNQVMETRKAPFPFKNHFEDLKTSPRLVYAAKLSITWEGEDTHEEAEKFLDETELD